MNGSICAEFGIAEPFRDSLMASSGLWWLTTWTLLGRDRPDDKLATAATRKGQARVLSGDTQESVNFRLVEHLRRREANEARLFARAGKNSGRIGQAGTLDKT